MAVSETAGSSALSASLETGTNSTRDKRRRVDFADVADSRNVQLDSDDHSAGEEQVDMLNIPND